MIRPEAFRILERIPFNQIEAQLRDVHLRGRLHPETRERISGFYDDKEGRPLRPYVDAKIEERTLSPAQLAELYTPQPHVYQKQLDIQRKLADLFLGEGIDIFKLNGHAFHFHSQEEGEELPRKWTMMPVVIEECMYPFISSGQRHLRFDSEMFRADVPSDVELNSPPDLIFSKLPEENYPVVLSFPLPCDGMHRVYRAIQEEKSLDVIWIKRGPHGLGIPYYAYPQEMCLGAVKVIPEGEVSPKGSKLHVLCEPHHKELYRNFPAAGLFTGGVRADRRIS